MRWLDRWTGRPADAPRAPALPGRWMLDRGPARRGAVELARGDRLTPLGGERWQVESSSGGTSDGGFSAPDGIEPLVDGSLRHIADALGDDPDPETLTATCPLVPEIDRRVEPTALTVQLEAELGHLLDICRAPHLRLRVEAERRPLDRVKRPDRRAPLTLASRADDWEAPTLTGVRPRRLLARVIDDEVDFYENRAAARLVDHLLRWLTERLAELDALVALLEDARDFSDRLGGVEHRRLHRLTTLWGEGSAHGATLEIAEDTRARVAALRRDLQGTLDSRLYRAIPARTRIGDSLRQTNLLRSDQRYRFVARLWQAWLAARQAPEADPHRRHVFEQRRARDVDAFALLVLVRALDGLGVTLRRDDRTPRRFTLAWHMTRGHLTLAPDGTLTLAGPDHPTWRLVPLPWRPSVRPDRLPTIAAELAAPAEPHGVRPDRTLALCVDVDPPPDPTLSFAFDPAARRPIVLPISPLCLESIERVRLALRWWLHAPRLAAWPLETTLPSALRPPLVDQCPELQAVDDHRRPGAIRLANWPRAAAAFSTEAIEAIAEGIPPLRRDPDARRRAATDANEALTALTRRARDLARCPGCEQQAAHPDRIDARAFRFTCPACATVWRLDACARCGETTPVIDEGDPPTSTCVHCPQ